MALRTLYQALLDSDPSRLRVIARLWMVELNTSRRTDMAAELVNAVASAEAITDGLTRLSSEEREALDDLVRAGGLLPWAIFSRRWGEVRTAGPGRVEREELWRAPVSAAEALWYMGWVHRAFDEHEGRAVEMAFVPEDLMLYVPGPPPVQIPPPPGMAPPSKVVNCEDALADDLVTLWSAVQRADDNREHLLAEIHSPAAQRLHLLETLSVESGWLRRAENEALSPVPNAILAWLQSDPWAQWSSLAEAWMASEAWDDLAHVETLVPDPVNGWPHDARATRQAFLQILRECDPDRWYGFKAFTDYTKRYAPDFLRPDGDYDSWAPRDARTDAPLRGFDSWHAVEGALILQLLRGSMFWLGLLTLDAPRAGAASTAFRLTAAGAAILARRDPPDIPASSLMLLGSDGEIEVPRRRRYERFQLSRIADPVGAPGAYRYRLSPSSLDRAKQQHIPYERIITFFEESTSSGSLPRYLRAAIQRAYQGKPGATLSRRWILQIPDPQVLQMPAMRSLVVEQLSDNLIAIRGEDRARAAQILLENGILTDFGED